MVGRLSWTRARLRFSTSLSAAFVSCATLVWYTTQPPMLQSSAVAGGQPASPASLRTDARSPPQSPVALSSAASSAVASSVKRPYAPGDDTLPSPPAPPTPPSLPQLVQGSAAHSAQRRTPSAHRPAALSGAQFAERWMASDVMEEVLPDATANALVADSVNLRTASTGEWASMGEASAASNARAARRHGSLMLVSPAPADDSTLATPPPLPQRPGDDYSESPASAALQGMAAVDTPARADAAPTPVALSPPTSAATAARVSTATPQGATAAPLSVLSRSAATTTSFSSPKRRASLTATAFSASAERELHAADQIDAAAADEHHHAQQQPPHPGRCEGNGEEMVLSLRRRLREAETFAAEQQARCEAAAADKEELHRRLTTLMGVEEELERRCQRQQAHAARAEQRRASERRVLELENAQAVTELTAAQEKERLAWQQAATAAQTTAEALEIELTTLRQALAEANEELHTALEEQLVHEQRSVTATAAQASAESECAALRAEVAGLKQQVTHAEAAAEIASLRRQLWGAEERAAAAEHALNALCEKLTTAAAAMDAAPAQDPVVDSVTPANLRRDPVEPRSAPAAAAPRDESFVDEGAVLAAAVAAMQRHGVPAPAASAPVTPTKTEATDAQGGSPEHHTPSAAPTLTQLSTAPPPPRLSNAGLLHCRGHRQAVQAALARVHDGQKRAARQATATADARAAEMERVLTQEIAGLRARLAEVQAAANAAELQHNTALPCRASVGINTAAAAMPTESSTRAATARRDENPHSDAADAKGRDALVEAQRQLRHERGYVAQLEKELASLRASTYCTSVLEGLGGTVQDMRIAVYRIVRDAVADMQRVAAGEAAAVRGVEHVHGDDEGSVDGVRRRWRRMEQAPLAASGELGGVFAAGALDPRNARSLLLNFTFMRGIERVVLRTEAQVEQVRAGLRPLCSRTDEEEGVQDGGRSQQDPPSCQPTRTSSSGPDSRHLARSQRLVERPLHATNGSAPVSSLSLCAAAVEDGTGRRQQQRTAQQQQVYDDMRALLERAAGRRAHETAAAGAAVAASLPPAQLATSRYSPDASRWMSGVRPPPQAHLPQRPHGMNVSPSSSPYVSAYVHASAAVHRTGRTAGTVVVQQNSSELLRSTCTSLTDVAQELRNVWHLLDGLRDVEETRAARQRQCLVRWQDAILLAVDEVLHRVEEALAAAWRPRSDASVEATPRDTAQRERDARLVSPVRAALEVPATSEDDASVRRASPPPFREAGPPEGAVRRVAAPSRLADVLSGRAPLGSGSDARASSGAVLFA